MTGMGPPPSSPQIYVEPNSGVAISSGVYGYGVDLPLPAIRPPAEAVLVVKAEQQSEATHKKKKPKNKKPVDLKEAALGEIILVIADTHEFRIEIGPFDFHRGGEILYR